MIRPEIEKPHPDEARKVNRDDCWHYAGVQNDRGYGLICMDNKRWSAHRTMYENMVGAIPDGLVIDHLCVVPICVNPDHLEAVTQSVNIKRKYGIDKCKRGHDMNINYMVWVKGKKVRRCRTCLKREGLLYHRQKAAKKREEANYVK